MRVRVNVDFNGKSYSLDREEESHWPGREQDIKKFVRETLEEAVADIERLESQCDSRSLFEATE